MYSFGISESLNIQMRTSLRDFLRHFKLTRFLHPPLAVFERLKLSRICRYEVRQYPDGRLHIAWNGHVLDTAVPSASFAGLAASPHELPTMTAFLRYISSGYVVWDVGASIGFYSFLAARLTSDSGLIVSFEPNPCNFERLTKNISGAGVKNVVSLNYALSDQEGKVLMADLEVCSTTSRVVSPSSMEALAAKSVLAIRGDSLVESCIVPVPNFIKVDVEGHELAVLRGMQRTLMSPECRVVVCEVHYGILSAAGVANCWDELRRMLCQAGFTKIKSISRSHVLALKN